MKKIGKIGKKWIATRKAWIKSHPPDFSGFYYCYLCGKAIETYEMTIDHVIPRSRMPNLRFEESNLRPCCYVCNSNKGSRVYDKNM